MGCGCGCGWHACVYSMTSLLYATRCVECGVWVWAARLCLQYDVIAVCDEVCGVWGVGCGWRACVYSMTSLLYATRCVRCGCGCMWWMGK